MVSGAVIVALVILLAPGHSGASAGGPGSGPQPAASGPVQAATNLLLSQLQVGDCLTGANMQLNTTDPWPELTSAVPCSRPHTAEVFFADNNFWPKDSPYPGDKAINADGNAACDSAFLSYVGVPYTRSIYTWTNIIPDASTWSTGDRGLHCIAYYPAPRQPAGLAITGSVRGARK